MKGFKNFINDDSYIEQTLVEMMLIMDTDIKSLNEMFETDNTVLEEGFKDVVKDLVHIKKGRGLIQQLKSAGLNLAKLFVALIKNDLEEVKKILKSVKKEDVLTFIMTLDGATLHILSTPIHTLSAITGWKIEIGKIKQGTIKIVDKIKGAIKTIKQNLNGLIAGKKQKQYFNYLDTIDKSMNDPKSFTKI